MNTWIFRMKGSETERERERVTGTNLSSWLLPSAVPLPPTKTDQKNWLFILESIKFNWWPPRFTPSTPRTSDFIASNFAGGANQKDLRLTKHHHSSKNKTRQRRWTPVNSFVFRLTGYKLPVSTCQFLAENTCPMLKVDLFITPNQSATSQKPRASSKSAKHATKNSRYHFWTHQLWGEANNTTFGHMSSYPLRITTRFLCHGTCDPRRGCWSTSMVGPAIRGWSCIQVANWDGQNTSLDG